MKVIVRPSEFSDIVRLHWRLRASDVEELAAMGSRTGEALASSYALSKDYRCWTAEYDGEVQVMFGVAPSGLRPEEGTPWLLASDRITEFSSTFLRESRKYIEEMHSLFPTLRNYVHANNRGSVLWLKWLGFTFNNVVDVNGTMFIEFEKTHV